MSRLSTVGDIVPVACEVASQRWSPRSVSLFLPKMSHSAAREEGQPTCVGDRYGDVGGAPIRATPHVIELSTLAPTDREDRGYGEGARFLDRTSSVARQHHTARRWNGIIPARTNITSLADIKRAGIARLGINRQHEACEQEEHARLAFLA
eukprot:5127923-Prymnesium_polylepis.1